MTLRYQANRPKGFAGWHSAPDYGDRFDSGRETSETDSPQMPWLVAPVRRVSCHGSRVTSSALVPLAVLAASCDGHVVVFAGRQNLAHMAFGPVLDRRNRRDQ